MIYAIRNTAPSPRVFYDARQREIKLDPGNIRHVELDDGTFARLMARGDLQIEPSSFGRKQRAEAAQPAPQPQPRSDKPPIFVTGHFGIGDNLHQRAVMRELMKQHDVWLNTCHYNLYHDLIEQGLKLMLRPTALHAQAKTIARERSDFNAAAFPPPPGNARKLNIGYPKVLVDQHGSILEAMFGCVGLKMPEKPDFSLPLRPEWIARAKDLYLSKWNTGGKPLMVHRPITVRREWDGRSRNPDPVAYDELYRLIREHYFVVSIADLANGREWIDGPRQQVDVELHHGELTFTDMAAVFAAAELVFCNAGFAPVLAQAVGTPVVVVYGGRESFRTTQRVGMHLAPTLPIDVINPCDCHSASHACDKRIDMPVAREKLKAFTIGSHLKPKTLIFGTFYIDSPDRQGLTELWKRLHTTLNPDCDFLAVDSQSPEKMFADWTPYDGKRHSRMYYNFPDNIGHLSRKFVTPGRDGWGRAFCKGLEIACELGYEHVAHIEGDSLFRLKVADVVRQMRDEKIDVATTTVEGMRVPGANNGWCETGLMFFTTDYIKRSNFIRKYDWPNRRVAPTPERWIRQSILEKDRNCKFKFMNWKALRADRNQITADNILSLNLDWVTHQHDSAQQDVYRKFVDEALKEVMPVAPAKLHPIVAVPQPTLLKLNLGCGTNRLAGWENHDVDVDITNRLPWPDNSASHVSIEHCVEHISYKRAIEFFRDAHRVLAPGGVLRVTVPSLEQIAKCEDADYFKFTTKWQTVGATKRGAMQAIIFAHGHEMVWNAQLMKDTLYFVGFDDIRECKPGESEDPILRGVEGHGKVIGDKFNLIESCVHEARKSVIRPEVQQQRPERRDAEDGKSQEEVAVIIGGAECWREDLEQARKLIGERHVRYFLINDQIRSFPEAGIATTLHPDKLNGYVSWLAERRKRGLPEPLEIWAHRKHAAVTHDTASIDWSGSTGLFAVQVARKKGFTKIIGCGIPMTVDGGHFERHQKWQSAIAFRQGWVQRRNEIAPYFRSMSGWTKEQFKEPDEEWLQMKTSDGRE